MVRLVTLCENTAGGPGFVAEWGLSILVQAGGENVLLDTGGSFVATRNADKLGVNFTDIKKIVLSHAHADHTGGLCDVLKRTGKAEIFAHPAIWEMKYTKRPHEDIAAFIGIPYVKDQLELLGASFTLSKDPIRISDTIMTSGEIPFVTPFESVEANFYKKEENALTHDSIPDDLALIVKSEKGLVIVLGCSHRGLINTIYHAQNISGEKRVHTIVGGTHLLPKTEEQTKKTIEILKDIGLQKIGVSHCTGFRASVSLAHAFGDAFFPNNAGTVCEIK